MVYTVKDLIDLLSYMPPRMEVKVGIGKMIGDLNKVITGVDMDTNLNSVWLLPMSKEAD